MGGRCTQPTYKSGLYVTIETKKSGMDSEQLKES